MEWQGSCAPSVEKILEVSLPWSARSKFDAYRYEIHTIPSRITDGPLQFLARNSIPLRTSGSYELTTPHNAFVIWACETRIFADGNLAAYATLFDPPSRCSLVVSNRTPEGEKTSRAAKFQLNSFRRYGEGVYSYLNPASADVHATSSLSSPYRVMLACDVLIADQDDADQVDDGERVYVANADAVIPCYVILYKF